MSNIELPINSNVPVRTYNHHAFGLGILMTAQNAYKWIYDNYILLSYYSEESFYTFDFYMDYIYCQPVFEREHLDDDIIKMRNIDCMKLIIDAITTNRYVVLCVNELFIPNTLAYSSFNFDHNILIYGYDKKKKLFKIMGYDVEQKSSTWEVSYSDIKKASPHKITFLRLHNDYEYEVHPEYILKQIGIFMGYIQLEPVGCYTSEGRYIGIEACKKLKDDMEKMILELSEIDIKPFSVLKEYTRLMHLRMNYLRETTNLVISSETFENIADKFEVLMNRAMIYNMRIGELNGQKLLSLFDEAIFELQEGLKRLYKDNI